MSYLVRFIKLHCKQKIVASCLFGYVCNPDARIECSLPFALLRPSRLMHAYHCSLGSTKQSIAGHLRQSLSPI
jgi:hypothetical protein